ncbi:hypothetical protein SETIT_7G019800v2 [Setaria italica]|uniref:Uncharacterized protein n=1 Tax=Setaria italica TaxID=4555 RepID=A0A368RR54_SETIT|nr:hypothetical protein SETIT_7G019800v2 [Setaria italica]
MTQASRVARPAVAAHSSCRHHRRTYSCLSSPARPPAFSRSPCSSPASPCRRHHPQACAREGSLKDPTSCSICKFEDEYEAYLREEGNLGSTSLLDAVPELPQEFDEMKERVAIRESRINWCCIVLGS